MLMGPELLWTGMLESSMLQPMQAIHKWVMDGADIPMHKQHMTVIPTESLEEFYLPLAAFNMTASAKNGCGVLKKCLNRFVQNQCLNNLLF